MLRILRVMGASLSPAIQDGDYVLVVTLPILKRRLKPADVVAFHHPDYGILIKRIASIAGDDRLYVTGTDPASVDSRTFGPIHRREVIGKVIWHIRAPRRP